MLRHTQLHRVGVGPKTRFLASTLRSASKLTVQNLPGRKRDAVVGAGAAAATYGAAKAACLAGAACLAPATLVCVVAGGTGAVHAARKLAAHRAERLHMRAYEASAHHNSVVDVAHEGEGIDTTNINKNKNDTANSVRELALQTRAEFYDKALASADTALICTGGAAVCLFAPAGPLVVAAASVYAVGSAVANGVTERVADSIVAPAVGASSSSTAVRRAIKRAGGLKTTKEAIRYLFDDATVAEFTLADAGDSDVTIKTPTTTTASAAGPFGFATTRGWFASDLAINQRRLLLHKLARAAPPSLGVDAAAATRRIESYATLLKSLPRALRIPYVGVLPYAAYLLGVALLMWLWFCVFGSVSLLNGALIKIEIHYHEK